MYIYVDMYMYIHLHMYTHTHTHTYTLTHTHTHTHTLTHINTGDMRAVFLSQERRRSKTRNQIIQTKNVYIQKK